MDERIDQMKRLIRREAELSHELHETWPRELDCEVNVEGIGASCIRAWVFVPLHDPKGREYSDDERLEITQKARRHLVRHFGRAERGFRDDIGTFYWAIAQRDRDDEDGTFDRFIFLDHAHPESCVAVPITKTVTVYEASCKGGPVEKAVDGSDVVE
jgi:hypothetical protein